MTRQMVDPVLGRRSSGILRLTTGLAATTLSQQLHSANALSNGTVFNMKEVTRRLLTETG